MSGRVQRELKLIIKMKTWIKKKRKQIKEWWEDLIAWLRTYRTLPRIDITADEIVSNTLPVFKMRGRFHTNITVSGSIICNQPNLIDADALTKIEMAVTTKEFFDQLGKWYSGYPNRNPYLVKFYCQVETFSYEIYKEDRAFFGDPAFRSEIYNWWHSPEDMYNILRDIERQLFILKTNN